MKLYQNLGFLISLTGILQILLNIYLDWEFISYMFKTADWAKDSFFYHSTTNFWLSTTGLSWIFGGLVLHLFMKESKKIIPDYFGWFLLCMAIFGTTIMPVSMLWLFYPISFIILLENKNNKSEKTK